MRITVDENNRVLRSSGRVKADDNIRVGDIVTIDEDGVAHLEHRPTHYVSVGDLIRSFSVEERDALLASNNSQVQQLVTKMSLYASAGVQVPVSDALYSQLQFLGQTGILSDINLPAGTSRADEIFASLGGV